MRARGNKAYKRADQAPELANSSKLATQRLAWALNAVSKRPGCPRPQIAFLLRFRAPGPIKT